MSISKHKYYNADDWRAAAMRRYSDIDEAESGKRSAVAETFNRQRGNSDADTLADQQLYIQGKMELEEYQDYLLFKHSTKANQNEVNIE